MKKILIFGGTGLIGEAIVKKLIEEKINVTFTYFKNESKALELESLGATKIQHELNSKSIFKLSEKFDGAIYSIGIYPDEIFVKPKNISKNFHAINEITFELQRKLIDLFITGPYEFLKYMTNHSTSNANILFINTLDGVKTPPSPVFFSQCRSSYKGLVESGSRELGVNGIKVNQINLGLVEGPTSKQLSNDLLTKYLKYCSLNRMAMPIEIANFASWFVLNNTYVTGQSIILDGAI